MNKNCPKTQIATFFTEEHLYVGYSAISPEIAVTFASLLIWAPHKTALLQHTLSSAAELLQELMITCSLILLAHETHTFSHKQI